MTIHAAGIDGNIPDLLRKGPLDGLGNGRLLTARAWGKAIGVLQRGEKMVTISLQRALLYGTAKSVRMQVRASS
jgi:hypothetical protein